MPTATAERRSQRISTVVPLVVQGQTEGMVSFREATFALSVSAHGALLTLRTKVAVGQRLLLMNQKNWDELEGQVAYIGIPSAGLTRVGIEFTRAAPEFWSLQAPPIDWS
jgi:hypothetical protein